MLYGTWPSVPPFLTLNIDYVPASAITKIHFVLPLGGFTNRDYFKTKIQIITMLVYCQDYSEVLLLKGFCIAPRSNRSWLNQGLAPLWEFKLTFRRAILEGNWGLVLTNICWCALFINTQLPLKIKSIKALPKVRFNPRGASFLPSAWTALNLDSAKVEWLRYYIEVYFFFFLTL
jgi:hypothetical protein